MDTEILKIAQRFTTAVNPIIDKVNIHTGQINASALTATYLPNWDGTKFVDSLISSNVGGATIDTINNAASASNILVETGGLIEYRTPAQILTDIGAADTGISGLTLQQVTDNGNTTTNNVTVNSLLVNGNLTVLGSATTINTEITTADAVIEMNDGEVGSGVTLGYSGLNVDRGAFNDYWMGFDETRDWYTIGFITGLTASEIDSTLKVATMANTMIDNGVAFWNGSNEYLETSSGITYTDYELKLGILNSNTGSIRIESNINNYLLIDGDGLYDARSTSHRFAVNGNNKFTINSAGALLDYTSSDDYLYTDVSGYINGGAWSGVTLSSFNNDLTLSDFPDDISSAYTLQYVTDNGNTTTNQLIVNNNIRISGSTNGIIFDNANAKIYNASVSDLFIEAPDEINIYAGENTDSYIQLKAETAVRILDWDNGTAGLWDLDNSRLGIKIESITGVTHRLTVNGETDNYLAHFYSSDVNSFISFSDNNTTNSSTVYVGAFEDTLVLGGESVRTLANTSAEYLYTNSNGDLLNGTWSGVTLSSLNNNLTLSDFPDNISSAYTLQFVTDNGNTTTNSIMVGSSSAPTHTLHVSGNTLITDTLTAQGDTVTLLNENVGDKYLDLRRRFDASTFIRFVRGASVDAQMYVDASENFLIQYNSSLLDKPLIFSSGSIQTFRLESDGQLRANLYGTNTFTGTTAYALAVDSSGNVIEIANPLTTLDLQVVTDNGNTTTNNIEFYRTNSEILFNSFNTSNSSIEQLRVLHQDTNVEFLNLVGNITINPITGSTSIYHENELYYQTVTGYNQFRDEVRVYDGMVGDLLVRLGDSADDGFIEIYQNGTSVIQLHGGVSSDSFINNGGNFGINVTTPSKPLHVYETSGGTGAGILLESGNGSGIHTHYQTTLANVKTGIRDTSDGDYEIINVNGATTMLQVNSSGDTTITRHLYVPEYIYHDGDLDTHFRFTNNSISLSAGASDLIWDSTTLYTQDGEHDLGGGSFYWGRLFVNDIIDVNGSSGTTSQVLGKSGSGIDWRDITDFSSSINYWSKTGTTVYYNGGNVGVGTSSPSALFEVNGISTFRNTVNIYNTNNTDQKLTINQSTTTHPRIYNYDEVGMTFHEMVIGGTNVDTNGIFITSTGAVVIGDTGTTYSFDVNGVINGRGNAYFAGGVGIGTTTLSTYDLAVYRTGGNTDVSIESATDDAYLRIASGTDNVGGEQSGIILADESNRWLVYKTTTNDLAIYNYNTANNVLFFNSATDKLTLGEYGTGSFTGGTTTYRLGVDASGNVIEIPIGAGAIDGSGTTNYLPIWTDADTLGNSILYSDGTNVGIGTISPSAPLHLFGNNTSIVIQDDQNDVLRLSAGSEGAYIQSGGSLVSGASNPLIFGSIFAADEWMRIDSSGNVGIGTTSPNEKLEVNGNVTIGTIGLANNFGRLQVNQSVNNDESGIAILSSGLARSMRLWVDESVSYVSSGNNGDGILALNQGGGYVGIGTASPGGKLEVISSTFDTAYLTRTIAGAASLVMRDSNDSGGVIQSIAGGGIRLLTRVTGTNSLSRIDVTSTGNVGIGTTSPSSDGYSFAQELVIVAGASPLDGAGITINSKARRYGVIAFGDTADVNAGEIYYDHTNNAITLRTNATKVFTVQNGQVVATEGHGTSANWYSGYTYSQVGHLPLAGGTMTGDIVMNSNLLIGSTQSDLESAWTSNMDVNSSDSGFMVGRYVQTVTGTKPPFALDNANWLIQIQSHPSGGAGTYGHQISGVNREKIYFRKVTNGAFDTWRQFWSEADFSSTDISNWNTAYNDKINSAAFNTGDGILTLTQQDGGTVTVDLDGRYLTSETDSQTLTWTDGTNNLAISGGNSVTITGFADAAHTHTHTDITNLSSYTGFDARYYTEAETQAFFNQGYIDSYTLALNLPVGWYTIATVSSGRASAEFAIWDINSSDHQTVKFIAAHHYGNDGSNTITVLQNSYFAGNPFRYIRIKDLGTYDGAAIQVYIDDATNNVRAAITGANVQSPGWAIKNWIPDATDPGNVSTSSSSTGGVVSAWASFVEVARINLNQIAQGGIATTGEMYLGGDTVQYRAFHENYHPNADVWTTARTITIGSTGKSVNGSANVSWSLGEIGAAAVSHTHLHTDITDFDTEVSAIITADVDKAFVDTLNVDADTLDSLNSLQFLRSDANDSFSGILTGTATGENLEVGGIRGTTKGVQTGDYIHLYERVHVGGPSGWGAATHNAPANGLSVWGSVDFGMNSTGVIQLDGTTIIDASRNLVNVGGNISQFTNDSNYLTANQTITLSGDVTGSGTVSITTTIASSAVEGSMLNNNVISSQTALTTGLISTDELLVSDAGTIKRMDISVIQSYMQSNLAFSNNSGTVTSVSISGTDGIDVVSGSPITTSGTITLGLSSIPNSSLANSTVSYGGVSLSLGGSDATPAFNLADATGYPSINITHDSTTGFVANEHIDHTTVSISAGTGLSGGGTIAANRTLEIDYLGVDNFIDSAANLEGTPIAVGDTIVYHDATDNNVKKGLVSDLPFSNNSGTVTSVAMSVPTGFAIGGSPITSSGTLALSFTAGYSLPTDTNQTNWTTAYNNSIVSASYNTGTKILTLTQQDAGTIVTAANIGSVTSVGGTGTVNGITLSGTVTTSGNLTLGGSLSVAFSDLPALTINRALISSASGEITVSPVTSTELSYLDGVTSNIQTQLGTKIASFVLEDGDGTEVIINDANEIKFVEGTGIDINWTDVSTGSDADPYDLTFAVTSAPQLTTARNINGTSFNGTIDITTATWGTSRTITIGSTGKAVNGSAPVSWTLGEIGAAAASHTHTTSDITSGTFADARIAQSNVTQHQAALSIGWGQLTGVPTYDNYNGWDLDVGGVSRGTIISGENVGFAASTGINIAFNTTGNITTYSLDTSYVSANYAALSHTLDSHSNVTITSNTSGEILKWNGSAWINNTLAEAGIASASHTHTLSELTDTNIPTLTAAYDGAVLAYDNTSGDWVPATGLNLTILLDDLSDVSVGAAVSTNILRYNGTTWQPFTSSLTVSAGTGLSGGGSVSLGGSTTINFDGNSLSPSGTLVGTDDIITVDGSVSTKTQISTIPLSIFNNDLTLSVAFNDLTSKTSGTGDYKTTGSFIAGNADGGAKIGTWSGGGAYAMFGSANMGATEYAVLTDGTNTFIAGGAGGATYIRSGANDGTPQLVIDGTTVKVDSDRVFTDGYHPNADTWTTSRSVTFATGDVTGSFSINGSANVSNVVLTIGAGAVEGSMLNNNVISSQTALTTGLISTDELLVSDAGIIKRMDISLLNGYFAGTTLEYGANQNFKDNVHIHFGNDSDVHFYYDGVNTLITHFDLTGAHDWHITDSNGNPEFIFFVQDTTPGEFHADGDIVAFSSSTTSDIRLKENILPISYGLDTIMNLNPVTFDWKRDNKHDIGFIAQEVEELVPELVKTGHMNTDYKTLKYQNMTAILTKAIQEQQEIINELKEKIERLEHGTN